MKRIALFAIAICVVGPVMFALLWIAAPNRTMLLNSSGADITDVRLTVRESPEERGRRRRSKRLPDGESLAIRHGMHDSIVSLSFVMDGEEQQFREGVDLWTGETWLIEITPDGSIESGYRHRD